MSQKEFLEELRTALSGKLSAQAVLENIEYYRNYIEGEVRSGKSEAQVLEMLGDPWILARTISDAQDGTDDSIVNEAGGSDYGAYGEETGDVVLFVFLLFLLFLIVCLIVQFFKGKR